jgi:hypothetical protein
VEVVVELLHNQIRQRGLMAMVTLVVPEILVGQRVQVQEVVVELQELVEQVRHLVVLVVQEVQEKTM